MKVCLYSCVLNGCEMVSFFVMFVLFLAFSLSCANKSNLTKCIIFPIDVLYRFGENSFSGDICAKFFSQGYSSLLI